MDLKETHDNLLAGIPSGVTHDVASCPLCSDEETLTPVKGGDMSESYTQEELDAAVATALKPLEEKIKEMQVAGEQSELETQFAQEKAALEASIADLKGQLDSKVLEVAEATKTSDDLVAYLESVNTAQAAEAELARRREERLAVVRDVASFPDEYVEANADRWAGLDDENFEALVNDWKAIASKNTDGEQVLVPAATAMVSARSDSKPVSAIDEIFGLTLAGVDLKSL